MSTRSPPFGRSARLATSAFESLLQSVPGGGRWRFQLGDRFVSDAREKTFAFTCPECFVSLKARVGQSGARLMCPSCSASIVVPSAPVAKSVAGQTDRTIDASAAEASGEYELHTTTRRVSEDGGRPTSIPPRSVSEASRHGTSSPSGGVGEGGGYNVRGSNASQPQAADLIAVTCPICKTRAYTAGKNLGKKVRCAECGTVMPAVETAKTQAQANRPQKIDETAVGEYGVSSPGGSAKRQEEITVPFHCRLCNTLLRGTLAQVGTELTCPDCGTKTVVPPPKKVAAKAVVGAAAGADLEEYGVQRPNIASEADVPVVCSLCHSRLMARADQVGCKVRCPDCGTETIVSAPLERKAGAVMGAIAETGRTPADDYAVRGAQAAAPAAVPAEVVLSCTMCGRKVMASTSHRGRDVACPDCGTLIRVPEQKAAVAARETGSPTAPASAAPAQEVQREKVVHIGVNCPRCGTRIHATDRQVGQKIPCPDCDTPITIPPPKADAVAEEQIIRGSEEYAVSAPPEVVSPTIKWTRTVRSDPADDPDFDFLDEVDDPELRWRLRDRSDELGFLGHPGASNCWLGFTLGGVGAFAVPALSLTLFGMPGVGSATALIWFACIMTLGASIIVCLAWGALFSVNLLAIVQDTSAGNHVIRNWPEGAWTEQIGESLYVFNSCLVSFIPISILLQNYPPARPAGMYLYMLGFWLTLPVVLLSMLETGSVLMPISGPVMSSLFRRPGAWLWFYFRSFGLLAVGLAMYLAFWRHLCGPITMPLLVPMATALAMVYARWLGILGVSVREVIEEAAETAES